MTEITVQSLHIYPIKSTSGIDLDRAEVGGTGLAWDRHWALVGFNNEVVTAREYPELLAVQTELTADSLIVRHAGRERFRLPLAGGHGTPLDVTVFGSPAGGVAVGDEIDRWFSELTGASCRLVCMSASSRRGPLAEHGGRAGEAMSYVDQAPLLLISRASLDDLNTRLETPVTMRNFRPNVVIDGCGPYAEDHWSRVEIAGVTFDVARQCQRCVFTTIDPGTGEKHPRQEPLRTLSKYRRHPDGGAAFGVHLVPRSAGVLSAGDTLAPA